MKKQENERGGLIPLSELVASKAPNPAISLRGKALVTKQGGYHYEIALNRCDTAAKILSWVIHLSEKTWCNTRLIEEFVRLAASQNDVEIEWNA